MSNDRQTSGETQDLRDRMRAEPARHQEELERLRAELARHQEELQRLRAESARHQEESQRNSDFIDALKESKELFKQQLHQSQDLCRAHEEELSTKRNQIAELSAQLHDAQAQQRPSPLAANGREGLSSDQKRQLLFDAGDATELTNIERGKLVAKHFLVDDKGTFLSKSKKGRSNLYDIHRFVGQEANKLMQLPRKFDENEPRLYKWYEKHYAPELKRVVNKLESRHEISLANGQ